MHSEGQLSEKCVTGLDARDNLSRGLSLFVSLNFLTTTTYEKQKNGKGGDNLSPGNHYGNFWNND